MEFTVLTGNEFVNNQDKMIDANYYQKIQWNKIKQNTGWECHFLGVKNNNKYIALALILSKKIFLKKKIFYSPRGMLLDYNNAELLTYFTTNIKDYVKKHGGLLFKIDPIVEYRERNLAGEKTNDIVNDDIIDSLKQLGYRHKGFSTGYVDEMQYRWSFYLDIENKSMEKIMNDMDQRCRRCIRKYEKLPLIIKEVNEENIQDFKAIMEHTATRQKHFDRSLNYYQSLQENFNDRIRMPIVYLDRDKYLKECLDSKQYQEIKNINRDFIPLSAGVFIQDKNKLNYVYGGTYSKYMPFMAQYKLQIEMIKYAIKKNLLIYDFGGIKGDFINDGVYEFKRGFGGRVVEYIGEFDLIIDKKLYCLYNFLYNGYRLIKKIKATLYSKIKEKEKSNEKK